MPELTTRLGERLEVDHIPLDLRRAAGAERQRQGRRAGTAGRQRMRRLHGASEVAQLAVDGVPPIDQLQPIVTIVSNATTPGSRSAPRTGVVGGAY